MYRQTLAWGRKGVGMTAISAVDIAVWDALEKLLNNQSTDCLVVKQKKNYLAMLVNYSQPLDTLAKEAQDYLDQGSKL